MNASRVLIDGSLYGRAVHLPIETKIEEQRLTLLDYLQTFPRVFGNLQGRGHCAYWGEQGKPGGFLS